ncbi:MAG: hypothetical protein ACE5E4_02020 [Candidatus Binatia bacterium]
MKKESAASPVSGDGESAGASGSEHWVAPDSATTEAEFALEALADDMVAVIDDCSAEEREALHDYAVSLVRERLPVRATQEEARRSALDRPLDGVGSNGASAFGYGVLLLLAGPVLLPVFPPVGVLLASVGLVALAWGLLAMVVRRIWASAARGPGPEGG